MYFVCSLVQLDVMVNLRVTVRTGRPLVAEPSVPKPIASLIDECLQVDPAARPELESVYSKLSKLAAAS